MAVCSYEKNGKTYWRVYIDIRGRKDSRVRVQKRINGITTEREARSREKQLLRELSEQASQIEAKGLHWGEVIERWVTQQTLFPSKRYAPTTLIDYAAILRNWTQPWLRRVASELNRADGRDIDRATDAAGKTPSFRKHLKNTINLIYTWGIEERLINGVHQSPVHGLEIEYDRGEKRPEILTIEEIRNLLRKAKEQNHEWYPIWVAAVFTGCRSGELHQMQRSDLEIIRQDQAIEEDQKPFDKRRYGFIRVRRSWSARAKQAGPTKAGYWRNIPVSSEFYWFMIRELNVEQMKPSEFLLPRSWEWDKGWQAVILRGFCVANKLPSVKFHTLRACFSTQLISTGVPATVVMKICGWKDMKTMQRYIRLSGIDEGGATEVLHFIPTQEAVMEKVVSIFDYQRKE